MSLLGTITEGMPVAKGNRIVIAGSEGVGKTTLGCGAPDALLLPIEAGYANISIAKTAMVTSFSSLITTLNEICGYVQQKNFPYRCIVIDSATALERYIHDEVLSEDPGYVKGNAKAVTMESALGGYGKAYSRANEKFALFLKICDWLSQESGAAINIIVTCHVFAAKLVDPQNGEYDSWDLLMHSPKNNKTYGKREMITQWADMIGFLYEPMYITKADGVQKGVSQQKGRMLGVNKTPSYIAKNRYNLVEEIAIPHKAGWNALAQAMYESTNGAQNVWNPKLK